MSTETDTNLKYVARTKSVVDAARQLRGSLNDPPGKRTFYAGQLREAVQLRDDSAQTVQSFMFAQVEGSDVAASEN